MKKRDVILDFTALLDVTLILLFFFILFSNLQVTDAADEAQHKMAEAENLMAEAQEFQDMLSQELEHIKDSSDRQGANIESILEFDKGNNLKLVLDVNDAYSWTLRVFKGDRDIAVISASDSVYDKLKDAIGNAEYTTSDTIICDYVYDASQPGSLAAYRAVDSAIRELKYDYKYFYYSETDISIWED